MLNKCGRAQLLHYVRNYPWFVQAMDCSAQSEHIVTFALKVFSKIVPSWYQRWLTNVKSSMKQNPWWAPELSVMRKKSRFCRKRFQRSFNYSLRNNFKRGYYGYSTAEKSYFWMHALGGSFVGNAPSKIFMLFRIKLHLGNLTLLLSYHFCNIRLMFLPLLLASSNELLLHTEYRRNETVCDIHEHTLIRDVMANLLDTEDFLFLWCKSCEQWSTVSHLGERVVQMASLCRKCVVYSLLIRYFC